MIVQKFGGSSVADAERIRRVAGIVSSYKREKPVVVVSALRGVTDELLALAHDARLADFARLRPLKRRHLDLAKQLRVPFAPLEALFVEIEQLCRGVSLLKELTPRTLDYAASFGERLSARLIAGHFTKVGLNARACDAGDVGMVTDDRFGAANPLPQAARRLRALSRARFLPVVTGFIGKSLSGEITTLGRNGSDYTAAILGAALGCREIQIWSDTDGIMTADPRVVPEARPLASLSFAEASELAYYGGKVLHPHTLVPAIEKNIPIRVLNSFKPALPGTVILARRPQRALGVQSIAFKRRQAIISATSPRMAAGPGFLGRIFAAFAAQEIDVDMVATSEVTVSASVSGTARLDGALAALRREFKVRLARERSVVCVVGEGIAATPGVAGMVFDALRQARVNVEMISQGASEINIALVVKDRDLERCVRALHARLFP